MPLPFKTIRQMGKYGLSGTSSGATLLGTTENGTQNFIPEYAIIHTTSASGVATMFTYSIGTNTANYNNIISSTTTGSISVANVFQRFTASNGAVVVAPNTQIWINITVPAVATALSVDVELFGYYK